MTSRTSVAVVAMVAVGLWSGCGSGANVAGTQSGDVAADGVSAGDVVGVVGADDAAGGAGDGGLDGGARAADAPGADAPRDDADAPCEGCFGAGCEDNADCNSGWCLPGPEGLQCSKTCSDECPAGYGCSALGGAGGDPTFVCLYEHTWYCRPCTVHADCAPEGVEGSEARCVPRADGSGSFCQTPCGLDNGCPAGAECGDGARPDAARLCAPADLAECPCSPLAIDAGATTTCTVSGALASCQGTRWCAEAGLTVCALTDTGELEVCNGLDDDCDDAIDESFVGSDGGGVGDPCDSDADADACKEGTWMCSPDGKALVCSEAAEDTVELCNDKDDDCDGETDEGFELLGQSCDGEDADACASGTWICAGDVMICSDDDLSIAELCNGQDDDCDGEIDEAFLLKGQACDGNDGDSCPDGIWVCDGVGLVCNDDAAALAETCNYKDDDCDGAIDESFPLLGQPCDGTDTDHCADGTWICAADGSLMCDDDPAAAVEVCNESDDDCDGETDEGFTLKGQPCDGADADLCSDGVWLCDGAVLVCNDDAQPNAELCNGKDDDCDGELDETFPNKGAPCDGPDPDACADGLWVCTADMGGLECTDDAAFVAETCNNLDDDCDGLTDEDFVFKGVPCDGADADECADGTWVCDGQGLSCTDDAASKGEICNGIDDDCDGVTDEGFEGKGEPCDGGDADECADGTLVCDGIGLICNDGDGALVELCNELDDDCDGFTDEDFELVGVPCDGGDGDLCADGVIACDGIGTWCNDDPETVAEECNDVDDDCDGETDEGCCGEAGQPCCDGACDTPLSCIDGVCQCAQQAGATCVDGDAYWTNCEGGVGQLKQNCGSCGCAGGECDLLTPPICVPGAIDTEEQGCGDCGVRTRTRTCVSGCTWGPWSGWSQCGSEGQCSPGEDETTSCGKCGTKTRTCTNQCSWGAWSGCGGQGPCSPGQTDTQSQSCDPTPQTSCGDHTRTRTCTNACTWGSYGGWSACVPKSTSVCLWEGGVNWQYCACSGGSCWQFCSVACNWHPCQKI